MWGQVEGAYRPRFGLDPSVIRLPIVPGSDPRSAYGDLVDRGVKGVVLEAYGKLQDLTAGKKDSSCLPVFSIHGNYQ